MPPSQKLNRYFVKSCRILISDLVVVRLADIFSRNSSDVPARSVTWVKIKEGKKCQFNLWVTSAFVQIV